MKFYFCETCGKRLTEQDLNAGQARDKKLKGVYCAECAVGVLTMETLPMTDREARKLLGKPAAPPPVSASAPASSTDHMVPVAADRRKSSRSISPARRAETPRPAGRPSRATTQRILVGVATGLVAALLLGLVMLPGSGTKTPPADHAEAKTKPADPAKTAFQPPPSLTPLPVAEKSPEPAPPKTEPAQKTNESTANPPEPADEGEASAEGAAWNLGLNKDTWAGGIPNLVNDKVRSMRLTPRDTPTSTLTCDFKIARAIPDPLTLRIATSASVPSPVVSVELNGRELIRGNARADVRIVVPPGLLKQEGNRLVLRNLAEKSDAQKEPYVQISGLTLRGNRDPLALSPKPDPNDKSGEEKMPPSANEGLSAHAFLPENMRVAHHYYEQVLALMRSGERQDAIRMAQATKMDRAKQLADVLTRANATQTAVAAAVLKAPGSVKVAFQTQGGSSVGQVQRIDGMSAWLNVAGKEQMVSLDEINQEALLEAFMPGRAAPDGPYNAACYEFAFGSLDRAAKLAGALEGADGKALNEMITLLNKLRRYATFEADVLEARALAEAGDRAGAHAGLEALQRRYPAMCVEFKEVLADLEALVAKAPAAAAGTLKPGLWATIFTGTKDRPTQKLLLSRMEPKLEANYGTHSPDPRVPDDYFTVVLEGVLTIEADGYIAFSTTADDRVSFTIDGELLCGVTSDPKVTARKSKSLKKGPHPIVVRYEETRGLATFGVQWRLPGEESYHSIPSSLLQHEPALEKK